MGNEVETQVEIARARSRLKSITKRKDPNQHASPKRTYTLAELNAMLDDAIEEHAIIAPTAAPREASPQPTVIRRWKSERSPRRSIEGVAFHPPEESPGKSRSPARPSTCHGGRSTSARTPRQGWPTSRLPLSQQDLGQGLRVSSPVKQRALMFETKEQNPNYVGQPCEAPHEPHIHMKEDWSVVPLHEPSEQNEKDLHTLKFGMTMYKPAKIPTDPPAEPEVEHNRKEPADASTDDTFDTAKQSSERADPSDEHNQPLVGHAHKTSKGWPFKWRMFGKASSVPPGANEDTVVAIPQVDDHYPSTGPSVVRRKVQELLKREEEEQSRRQLEAAHKGRRASRRPSVAKESELREPMPNPSSLAPAQLPPLQLPVQEEADLIIHSDNTMTAMLAEAKVKRTKPGRPSTTSMTPVHRSWTEKEVTELSKSRSDTAFRRSVSPVKPGPSTRMRGRSTKMRQSLSPRGSPYTTEHAFSLSPVPSGSPSRTSSPVRVHKVEVELRDSPGREARARGEKIMFVRTHAFEEAEEQA
jgi:hypothetical protein